MRLLTFAFACVAIARAASPAAAGTRLSINLRFAGRPPAPALVRSIEAEAAAIWAPYGVSIVSSSDVDDGGYADGSFDVVIAQRTKHVMKSDRMVLGSTRLQELAIDRSPIRIDYDAVQETLELLTQDRLLARTGHHGLSPAEIGRAIGRVLAHEIGHVLLSAPDHQRHGLMRPFYSPEDLVALDRSSFTLSPNEIERLYERELQLASLLDQ